MMFLDRQAPPLVMIEQNSFLPKFLWLNGIFRAQILDLHRVVQAGSSSPVAPTRTSSASSSFSGTMRIARLDFFLATFCEQSLESNFTNFSLQVESTGSTTNGCGVIDLNATWMSAYPYEYLVVYTVVK